MQRAGESLLFRALIERHPIWENERASTKEKKSEKKERERDRYATWS